MATEIAGGATGGSSWPQSAGVERVGAPPGEPTAAVQPGVAPPAAAAGGGGEVCPWEDE